MNKIDKLNKLDNKFNILLLNKFCDNILNYHEINILKKIENIENKNKLIQLLLTSLEKYKNEKDSIYYRRSYVLLTILKEQKKDYKFFFAIIHQPYLNFSFLENLFEFRNFINSNNLYKTIIYIKYITNNVDKFNGLTLKILRSSNVNFDAVCLAPRWFVTYNYGEFNYINKNREKKYNTKLSKEYGFTFLTDIDLDIINEIEDGRDILKNSKNALFKNSLKNIKNVKKCIEKAKKGLIKFIYYEISWIIENMKELKFFLPSLHRSNVILDFSDYDKTEIVNVLFMETSITEEYLYYWLKAETILMDSVKNDIENNLGLKCNIITFEAESCPRFDIQGDFGTCAIWSLYIFYLYIFCPSRRTIFNLLNEIDIRSRNDILLFFIFFVYKNYQEDVKKSLKKSDPNTIEVIKDAKKLRENCNF